MVEYTIVHPASFATATTDNRRSMSSPGGEETGEGGQSCASGATFTLREEIVVRGRGYNSRRWNTNSGLWTPRKSPQCSRALQNHVGVLGSIARPNQTDGSRHAQLEFNMRLMRQWYAVQGFGEGGDGRFGVGLQKLPGHPRLANVEIDPKRVQDLQHGRHIIDQGNIHGLDHRPEGKTTIGDDNGVGVAHPAEQRIQARIEDSSFKHRLISFKSAQGVLTRADPEQADIELLNTACPVVSQSS